MRRTSAPFQLGTQASPSISVTTNGPDPTATLRATRFVDGSTIATVFPAITGTQTLPPTTAGSPRKVAATSIFATILFVRGSIRASSPICVAIQTASAEAAVQEALSTGIRASTLPVRGSIRTTGPDGPATHTDPNAQTTP